MRITVVVKDTTGGGFVGLVGTARGVPAFLSYSFILFLFCTQAVITAFDVVQPFAEIRHFVQFLRRDLLGQSHLHTRPNLLVQFVIREVRGSSTEEGVFGLNSNGVVPEAASTLGHA
jgi:hypothetical protein